jgi:hypothetical protein
MDGICTMSKSARIISVRTDTGQVVGEEDDALEHV